MMTVTNVKSLKRILLALVMGVIFFFFILSSLYISKTFIDDSDRQTERNLMYWAQYISILSSPYLVETTQSDLKLKSDLYEKLEQLSPLRLIRVVDIYTYSPKDKVETLYLSYEHEGTFNFNNSIPEVQLTTEERIKLASPRITDNYAEVFLPILNSNKEKVGNIYLQANRYSGLSQNNQLLITISIIFMLMFIVIWVVLSRLEVQISSPLKLITAHIQEISKSKNFTKRLPVMAYQEADVIARNLNTLLNRLEKHIAKLQQAEEQSEKRNQELEQKITNRTAALKESNQELLSTLEKLHQFQDQLVESGKMASLGDMVAGVAHEVNTPIGLGVTASTLLADRLNEMKEHFDNKTLRSSQLKKFFNEGQENVGIIYRNLKRAAELISSFKKVAVDQSSEDIRQFDMNELVNEVLLTLAPQIKNSPYQINVHCPENLLIWSKPGPINQILINLILNSMLHAFEGRETGVITIDVELIENIVNINYQDDGKGIDKAIRNKIFEPFTTTKRGSGGSGLGLHLVYNLVTQALGGNIEIESKQNIGTKFEIKFPLSSGSHSI
ncbi:ATP-binding protein [Thalassotalea ganghwensis]